jgi:hypothetical protein
MNGDHSEPGGDVAKKAPKQNDGDTLGDIAAGLGTLLGNAEKQWRAWQGPRDAVVKAVTDVRDRAVALLSEMDVAGMSGKGGKKKDKKKGKKKDAAKAEKKKAEKADKKKGKDGKKADKKKGKKAGKAAPDMAAGPDEA